MTRSPLPIAVLISGTGRSLQNLIERAADGRLEVSIRLVISSNPAAPGLDFARRAEIPTAVIDRKSFASDAEFGESVFALLRGCGARIVVLAGFLKFLPIPPDFENRVINIHPALIPSFCGRGFYGHRVHAAVLEQGARVTGCTVRFVDNEYDHGPILLQRTVAVADDDTPDTLAARVFAVECEALPDALQQLAESCASPSPST